MISSDGITLKKTANTDGGEYSGSCPWCGGTDRFNAWPEKKKYWCRVCGKKGDEIQYLRDKRNMTYDEACAFVGKEISKEKSSKPSSGKSIGPPKKWDILDVNGKLVATHIRQDSDTGKKFWWEIDGKTGLQGKKTPDLPLYGAELIGKKAGDVLIVEGEKCADVLRAAGIQAVSTVTGAAACPSPETLEILKKVKGSIILWPDNDPVGISHMDMVQKTLKTIDIEVYRIKWYAAPHGGDAADFIESGEDVTYLIEAAKRRPIDQGFILIGEAAFTASEIDSDMLSGRRPMAGISTGFWGLDHAIGGWQKGLFYVLCARPGIGKTSFAIATMRKVATPETKVAFFSMETSKVRVASRAAWMEAGRNRAKVESDILAGRLTEDEKTQISDDIVSAYSVIYDLPMFIDDKSGLTTDDMAQRLEKLLAREPISLVVIDHMGKAADKGRSMYERTSDISHRLADMALEYNLPVVALCQLNRDVEHDDRKDKRPRLSDLRNSGNIEEDARVVLGLYRDSYYSEEPPIPDMTLMRVLKNNEGEAPLNIFFECSKKSRQWKDWPGLRNAEIKEYVDTKAWLPRRKKND